jgi:glycosyltransferase involved in cell wall biosynthesis
VKLMLKKLHWRKLSWRQLRFDLQLLRELKSLRADLVYVEDVGDLFFYLLQPFFLKKKTTVHALHDVVPHSDRTDLRSRLQALLFNLTRWLLMSWGRNFHIFSRTEYTKFRVLYPSKHAFYTRLLLKSFGSPVADESKVQIASGPGSIEAHCRLLFFGLIEYYKGLDLLIEAVESLVEEGFANFSLTIAGRGSHWPQCETLIRSTGHYDLRIRYIPDEEIPELFANHHFIVLPYRDASQSGPQMISLEYKLPAIASDVDGLSDFVLNDETGFIFSRVPGQSHHSLTDRLRQCLTLSEQDYTGMRQRLSAWKEQHYRIDDTIGRYVQFFNELMEAKS